MRRQGPVRRRLRELQHASTRRPSSRTRTRRCPARRRCSSPPSTTSSGSPTRSASRSCSEWTQEPAACSPRSPTRCSEWLEGEGDKALADWDISRDAPYFGIRDPGRAGQVLLRLARRADRLPRAASRTYLRASSGIDFDSVPAGPAASSRSTSSARTSSTSTRCSGRRCSSSPARRTRCPTTSTCTASSPCPARRCRSRAAPASARCATSSSGMNPEWLRYYIAAKLNANVEDLDFNPDDFVARVNSDLVGKYVNIASRCAVFLNRKFGGELDVAASTPLVGAVRRRTAAEIAALLRGARVRQGAARSDGARRRVNQYVDERKPWELAKEPARSARAAARCARSRSISSGCSPSISRRCCRDLARGAESFLGVAGARVAPRGPRSACRAPHRRVPAPA